MGATMRIRQEIPCFPYVLSKLERCGSPRLFCGCHNGTAMYLGPFKGRHIEADDFIRL